MVIHNIVKCPIWSILWRGREWLKTFLRKWPFEYCISVIVRWTGEYGCTLYCTVWHYIFSLREIEWYWHIVWCQINGFHNGMFVARDTSEESRECRPEAESKEKHGVWDPMPELTITSPYVDTFTIGNPMPQSRLYLLVRDLGFSRR